jgi:asparagine synthase (glutamine-hydrolysing)
MCGIVGLVGGNISETTLRVMCAAIQHRGPDDEGLYVSDDVGLGSRRLSIIDLANGHQPLANEDESVWVTFNGEIYNFSELRWKLIQAGHNFRTKTDTETIVHAYEEYGNDCVRHFNGMFAFALWDARRMRLLLARDRLGIKPLYYAQLQDGTLAFASEIKALRQLPQLSTSLDLTALDQYLRLQFIPAPRTIFSNVRKLEAGHRLIWEIEAGGDAPSSRIERYWAPRFQPQHEVGEEEWLARLDAHLMRSVGMQLVSDVPLGAFLSGGTDSTAVVLAMSRLMDQPVKTFTIGFADSRYDESEYASAVAKHLGTDHHHIMVPPGIDSELFGRLIAQLDEPLADSSFIPTYHVSRLAREQVKVVLTGDGGDETFAGYDKYHTTLAWNARWQKLSGVLKPVRPLVRCVAPAMPGGRRTTELLALEGTQRLAELTYRYYSFDAPTLYGPDLASASDGLMWQEINDEVRGEEPIAQLQHADYLTYLPEDILMKVDKMSMAVSLEARVPLLDHRLQEMTMDMPASLKTRGRERKYVLKKWLRGKVPDVVLDRAKIGFAPTLSYWLGNGWESRAGGEVLSGYGVRNGLFRREGIERLIEQRDLPRLWNLWVWETWARDARL